VQNSEIVQAIVTLGGALGKSVIAEGVETAAQLAHLRKLGCGFAQGYLLSRPLPAEVAEALLDDAAPITDLATLEPATPTAPAATTGPSGIGSITIH
jgi:predicted signal transduction protein with EAL and GGDEF domain